MKYRPVDENGDMKPVQFQSQMLEGSAAVAAAVNSRLELIRGDWWEDETVGFSVPPFLIRGMRGNETAVQTLVGYISAYIRQTEGVKSIASSSYTLGRRKMTADIAVTTDFGNEEVDWSVDLNELLGTIT